MIEAKIKKLEKQIAQSKKKLASLRKQQKPQPVKNYKFKSSTGKDVSLSQLFGDKNELIFVHNMGAGCPYCSLWADGFNGLLKQLETKAAFALESADPVAAQVKLAKRRGWKFKMVSSKGTKFKDDLKMGTEKSPMPGLSTFFKRGDQIYRLSHTILGPGDNYCVAWDLMDLLPSGSGDWEPLPNSK